MAPSDPASVATLDLPVLRVVVAVASRARPIHAHAEEVVRAFGTCSAGPGYLARVDPLVGVDVRKYLEPPPRTPEKELLAKAGRGSGRRCTCAGPVEPRRREGLAARNGLSIVENEALFDALSVSQVTNAVLRGLARVYGHSGNPGPGSSP